MAKAVIFDFGRVLGSFDKMRSCEVYARHSALSAREIHDLLVGSEHEKGLESGSLTAQEFAANVCHVIGTQLQAAEVLRAWGDIFDPNPAIETHVDRLMHNCVPIGVLSNTNAVHWQLIAELPIMRKLRDYGAPLTLSHEVGVMKPHRQIYEQALRKVGIPAPEVLYIDDTEPYVLAARQCGMCAEQYDCTRDSNARLDNIFRAHELL